MRFRIFTLLLIGTAGLSVPGQGMAMPKTSTDVICTVVEIDLPDKVLTVEPVDKAGSRLAVEWTHQTIVYSGSREISAEELPVGAKIDLRYISPIFNRHSVARQIRWLRPDSKD